MPKLNAIYGEFEYGLAASGKISALRGTTGTSGFGTVTRDSDELCKILGHIGLVPTRHFYAEFRYAVVRYLYQARAGGYFAEPNNSI